MNEGTVDDYVDLQRLMFSLNTHYRSRSFRVFGETRVSAAFRENVRGGFEQMKRPDPDAKRLPGLEDADLDGLG